MGAFCKLSGNSGLICFSAARKKNQRNQKTINYSCSHMFVFYCFITTSGLVFLCIQNILEADKI